MIEDAVPQAVVLYAASGVMQKEVRAVGERAAALQATLCVEQADRIQNLQDGADSAVRVSGLLHRHGKIEYLNTGCCIHTKGITGIEIAGGKIMLMS